MASCALGLAALLPACPLDFNGGEDGPFGCCSPIAGDGAACCSDDPAAANGLVPAFPWVDLPAARTGEPLFSRERNRWSTFGSYGDAADCPRQCNPRWDWMLIDMVCGPNQACQQTSPGDLADCVFRDGRWRAIRGTDVDRPEDWIVDEPGTRQDPELVGCTEYATMENGDVSQERLLDCVHQLGTALDRGICGSLPPGHTQVCVEGDQPGQGDDPCKLLNP